MTNNEGSQQTVDLSFLDKGRPYLAYIYTDGGEEVKTRTHVRCTYLLVDASQRLHFTLQPRGGAAIRLVPATGEETGKYKKYRKNMKL